MAGNLLDNPLDGGGGSSAVSLVLSLLTTPGAASVSLPTLAPLATKVRVTAIGGGGGSPATGVAECAGGGASGEVHRAIFDIESLPDPVIIYIGAGGDPADPVTLGEGVPTMFNCGDDPSTFTDVGDYGLFVLGGGAALPAVADTGVAVGGSPINGPIDTENTYTASLIESLDWQISRPGGDLAGANHALHGIVSMQGHPGLPSVTVVQPGGYVSGAGASGAEAGVAGRAGKGGCILLELW